RPGSKGAVIAMAPVLVDAAHSVDRDFLDQKLLGDLGLPACVEVVADARRRIGGRGVGSGVLLHDKPPGSAAAGPVTARPSSPDAGDGMGPYGAVSPCFRPSSPHPDG